MFRANISIGSTKHLDLPVESPTLNDEQRTNQDFFLCPQHFVDHPGILVYVLQITKNAAIDIIPRNLNVALEPIDQFVKEILVATADGFQHQHPKILNTVSGVNKLCIFVRRTRQIVINQLVDQPEL